MLTVERSRLLDDATLALTLERITGALRVSATGKADRKQAGDIATGHQRLAGPCKSRVGLQLRPEPISIARHTKCAKLYLPIA